MDERYNAPHCYVVRTRNGYAARAYVTRSDNWNAIGRCIEETEHRTQNAAMKSARRMAKAYPGATLADSCKLDTP